jgi:hypothetical protein
LIISGKMTENATVSERNQNASAKAQVTDLKCIFEISFSCCFIADGPPQGGTQFREITTLRGFR